MQAFSVKWGTLVPGRSETVEQRRWHLMRSTIPYNRDLEMHQQVCSLLPRVQLIPNNDCTQLHRVALVQLLTTGLLGTLLFLWGALLAP